jgi:hypothetical protein
VSDCISFLQYQTQLKQGHSLIIRHVVASPVNNISLILDAELKYINLIKEQGNENSKCIHKSTAVLSCRSAVQSVGVDFISNEAKAKKH